MRIFFQSLFILFLFLTLSACSISSNATLAEVEEYNGVVKSTVESYKAGLSKYVENKEEFLEFITNGVPPETLNVPEEFSFPESVSSVLGNLPFTTPAYEGYFTAYGFNGVRAVLLFTGNNYKYRVESIWNEEGLHYLEVGVH